MNIVTSSDSNLFHCLKELAKSVRKFYGKPIIVYDLGLTESQKQILDAVIIPISIDEGINFQLCHTHKPFCVKHYFENYSEPMIFVDVDCLFAEKVEESGFDVGITYEHKRKSRRIRIINSGVIFFNVPANELVDRWANECSKPSTKSDQRALWNILSETVDLQKHKDIQQWRGLKIKIFDGHVYNDCRFTRRGKIVHFKGTRHRKDIYEKLMAGCEKGKNVRKMFKELERGKNPV